LKFSVESQIIESNEELKNRARRESKDSPEEPPPPPRLPVEDKVRHNYLFSENCDT